jgi:hypothetical protein
MHQIFAVPAAFAVTVPLLLTAATFLFELFQRLYVETILEDGVSDALSFSD